MTNSNDATANPFILPSDFETHYEYRTRSLELLFERIINTNPFSQGTFITAMCTIHKTLAALEKALTSDNDTFDEDKFVKAIDQLERNREIEAAIREVELAQEVDAMEEQELSNDDNE